MSNFDIADLSKLLEIAKVKPHLVQNYFDPSNQDHQVRQLCEVVIFLSVFLFVHLTIICSFMFHLNIFMCVLVFLFVCLVRSFVSFVCFSWFVLFVSVRSLSVSYFVLLAVSCAS